MRSIFSSMVVSFSRDRLGDLPVLGVVLDFVLSVALSVAKGILREGESPGAASLSGGAHDERMMKPGFSPAQIKSSKFGPSKGDFDRADTSFRYEILGVTAKIG